MSATTKKECWSKDEENFNSDNLSELLSNNDELKVGDTVYVGDAVPPDVKHLCDSDDVIATISDRAYEMAGEYADDCTSVDDEAKAELDVFLAAWIEKHCNLNFWSVKNVKPHVLTAEDFSA